LQRSREVGDSVGETFSGLLPAIIIVGIIFAVIVFAAKRYNKKHGHDPDKDEQ
jgi:hypothetical protein